jgi:lipopolysaccharide export system permease protein
VLLGILSRYVMDQVLRAFVLAVLALTGVIVLIMVMAEATRQGLSPGDVFRLMPYIVPGTLTYTVPVAILFAVTVVYGRLAGDNEIIAMKAAGLGVWKALRPSLWVAICLSVLLCLLSGELIPRANHSFKSALFRNVEETFYMFLKRERQFDNPRWPFFIGVKDVREKLLFGATFKHRQVGAENPHTYDMTVQSKTAIVHFNIKKGVVEITMTDADVQGPAMYLRMPESVFEYPLPSGSTVSYEKKIQEMTSGEIARELVKLNKLIEQERKRQAVGAALWIAAGRINRVDWPHIGAAYRDYARWERQKTELETERYMRVALATGSFFFVLLGAPIGLLFARRDFLSAFITCFVPIIILYYPLVLAGVNLAKEGHVPPYTVMGGNLLLLFLAFLFPLPIVTKH